MILNPGYVHSGSLDPDISIYGVAYQLDMVASSICCIVLFVCHDWNADKENMSGMAVSYCYQTIETPDQDGDQDPK